jgi:hypothetical protein
MARPPRFEYPGAIYHVMARGDGGQRIFLGKEDCQSYLHGLERVCQSHGWRVHAWVLMGNLIRRGTTPERQPLDRVLDAFRLNHERRGRVAYVSWLETRAATDGGKIGEKAMEAIRGGWYLGEEGFKDKLLGLIDKASAKVTKRGSVAGAAIRAHGEGEAERIIHVIGTELGLPETIEELRALRKGDPGKVICAALVKASTSVTNEWLTARLCMGHPAAMCQLVSRARKDPKIQEILQKHEKTFQSKD